jgi:RNA-binding protein YlmH
MKYYLHPTLVAAAVLTVSTIRSSTSAFTVRTTGKYGRSLQKLRVDAPSLSGLTRRSSSTLLRFSIDDLESQALAASEAWDVHVTPFLTTAEAALVQERLQKRGDMACFRVGGTGTPSRARFVFTNPELGMDLATAELEYCVVLCVKNAKSGQDPWPNILTKIGVDLENVGDVLVADGTIYMAVTPQVAKQCTRLLPKEVVGAGVMVKALEPGEAMPEDGDLQDMDVKRLDKRAQYSSGGQNGK